MHILRVLGFLGEVVFMKKKLCILLVVILVALFAEGKWLDEHTKDANVAGSGVSLSDELNIDGD